MLHEMIAQVSSRSFQPQMRPNFQLKVDVVQQKAVPLSLPPFQYPHGWHSTRKQTGQTIEKSAFYEYQCLKLGLYICNSFEVVLFAKTANGRFNVANKPLESYTVYQTLESMSKELVLG